MTHTYFSNEYIADVLDCTVHPGTDDGLDGDSGCERIRTGNHQMNGQTGCSVSVTLRSN